MLFPDTDEVEFPPGGVPKSRRLRRGENIDNRDY